MKKADRIRVNSEAVFHQVSRQYIEEKKIRLIHLRVDLDLFNPLSILRINSEKNDDKIKIGYVGRLAEGKGLEDLLAAISQLCQGHGKRANFKVLIFGDGQLKSKLIKILSVLA
ncbi:MAG: hypothetical protein UV45_C0009G0007 [Candidatus Azambacteria bacterium GW2011_GWB1_42_72]|nr:MAG: hypothetical protein UV45_C0009G0007 [Candidatus Azambacteria bacterium GW2011_GWB1_42_72]